MASFGDLSADEQLAELRATLSDEDRALMEAALEGAKALGDAGLLEPDESNDARLWREAREGLEWRLRTRGVKRGEKAPRAVVQKAFADYVRGFMESNPGCEGTMEVVFEDIFACLEDEFVLKAAPLPPVSAAALPPEHSAAICAALLRVAGAREGHGVTSMDALLRLDDDQLVALGVPHDAVPNLRAALEPWAAP